MTARGVLLDHDERNCKHCQAERQQTPAEPAQLDAGTALLIRIQAMSPQQQSEVLAYLVGAVPEWCLKAADFVDQIHGPVISATPGEAAR